MNDFIWGIASASYQTEDPISDTRHPYYFEVDWDLFYKAGRIREPRGMATYSWSEVDRDLDAIQSLGVSHYRFGLEWARIEPTPGRYNEEALNAYVELARKIRKRGMTPVVCLWHFNFPSWLTNLEDPTRHGWFHKNIEPAWNRYVERVLEAFGDEVRHWMPQNEPNAYAFMGYVIGMFPPGKRASFDQFQKFMERAAYFYGLAADRLRARGHLCISVQNVIYWKKSWLDVTGFFWKQAEAYNFLHLDLVAPKSDIIGFNYYFKLSAFLIPGPRTVRPQGLTWALDEMARRYPGKPIWITENGMQEKGDKKRPDYIRDHVGLTLEARKRGVPVEAYFYWCLIDNFEWCQGYRERFGLFRMNPETRQLERKASADVYANLVREAKVPVQSSQTVPPPP